MDIYAQNILDRYKEPHYRDKEIEISVENEEMNHTCGDKIRIKLQITDSKLINNYSFSGAGCAISQAAADILGDIIIGKTADEVLNMNKDELYEALGIEISPRRSKCALLALETIKGAIRKFTNSKINNSSVIADIIKTNPKAAQILEEYGLGCAHCELGSMESIEEGAKAHGLSDTEIKKLIKTINMS